MTLSHFVAVLTAISLNANPSVHAIPATINTTADVVAEQRQLPAPPTKIRPEALGVEVSAKSALVVDVSSGATLFAKDATVQRPIASLTKLVTAMVVLDQGLRPDELITIQEEDFVDARPFFAVNDTLTRGDALRAMLAGSANEISNAFARTSSGGRVGFIEAMNAKAKKLGLTSAVLEDPTGINPRNRANAVDVARLLRSALGYPTIRETTTAEAYDAKTTGVKTVRIKPTNLLLTSYLNTAPYKIIAAKTGSLPDAGSCLAQVTQNAEGHQIITVALGSADHFTRFQDVKALTAWAFQTYEGR